LRYLELQDIKSYYVYNLKIIRELSFTTLLSHF